jgi:Tol biopolymer transport system component
VALVTLPPDVNYLDEDSFAFSIYWFDIATKELAPIGEGFFPVWSPDGHRMAFQRYASGVASLWVADMESGDVRTVVEQAPPGMQFSEVVWSPDGSQIAFVYGTGNANNPGIGRVDSTGEGVPHELVSPDAGEAPYHLVWTPDGQRLLYLSYNAAVPTSLISRNLWSLEVSTGSRAQLTTGWEIADYDLAPNNPWLAFTATALFESPDLALEGDTEGIEVDLWLLNMDTEEVRRLTFQEGFPGGLGGWSPNGTQIVVWISGSVTDPHSLQFYSLVDGTNTTFTLEPDYQFVAIGGEK